MLSPASVRSITVMISSAVAYLWEHWLRRQKTITYCTQKIRFSVQTTFLAPVGSEGNDVFLVWVFYRQKTCTTRIRVNIRRFKASTSPLQRATASSWSPTILPLPKSPMKSCDWSTDTWYRKLFGYQAFPWVERYALSRKLLYWAKWGHSWYAQSRLLETTLKIRRKCKLSDFSLSKA